MSHLKFATVTAGAVALSLALGACSTLKSDDAGSSGANSSTTEKSPSTSTTTPPETPKTDPSSPN